jgi:hypothetical protein
MTQMNSIRQYWGIVLASVLLSGALFGQTPASHEQALLFDYWVAGDSSGESPQAVAEWKSPSGKFTVRCLKSSADADVFILVGEQTQTKAHRVLGYGTHGVDVAWHTTDLGEVAVIDNKIDNGTNELLLVLADDIHQKAPWTLLYRTPNPSLTNGHVVAHCNWSVTKLDAKSGDAQLSALWDFSDVTNREKSEAKTSGTYDVPLFYGTK